MIFAKLFLTLGMALTAGFQLNASIPTTYMSPPTPPWGEKRNTALVVMANQYAQQNLSQYPVFNKPLDQEAAIHNLYPSNNVLIFAYGSLLNEDSAVKTISPTAVYTYDPAVAFGAERVFDISGPHAAKWGPLARPSDTGMLNLDYDGNSYHEVNGVLMSVSWQDLHKLIQREYVYELVPVPVMLWDQMNDAQNAQPMILMAYTFVAPDNSAFVSHHINPCPGYANASELGAAQYGPGFLQFWQNSTYLADHKTPYLTWKQNPNIDLSA